jgi:RNA polymerase sigma-70 factor (ECF subfamily)
VDSVVRRAQDGDAAAFECLYREHAGRVYALCLRLTADPARAEELTQDVFVRAWERLRTYRGASAFGSWLHRLAVNVVFGQARRLARRRRHEEAASAQRADPWLDPALHLDLEGAIAALPPGARAVFVLHDVEGFDHAEIARLAGIAEGTSKAQLHRARRLLREYLTR